MGLKPVRDYAGAQYPSLADYCAKSGSGWADSAAALAIALALLTLLVNGCMPNGIS